MDKFKSQPFSSPKEIKTICSLAPILFLLLQVTMLEDTSTTQWPILQGPRPPQPLNCWHLFAGYKQQKECDHCVGNSKPWKHILRHGLQLLSYSCGCLSLLPACLSASTCPSWTPRKMSDVTPRGSCSRWNESYPGFCLNGSNM